jgi:hypothetical protein
VMFCAHMVAENRIQEKTNISVLIKCVTRDG